MCVGRAHLFCYMLCQQAVCNDLLCRRILQMCPLVLQSLCAVLQCVRGSRTSVATTAASLIWADVVAAHSGTHVLFCLQVFA